ncbi:bifunctional acetate--CoA ligase family protein/GNAT family N-acetyltransferase [Caenimonas terrae]|uniref:Bifunctional acetate--CoA ligase family protein/GNAT family N-acetyltransferase n=1 Tax=Caenimonas terrae TaxID=696074 RepID=A0ABW0NJ82_9BURK
MSVRNLEAMFRPASIAVIGASDREGSVGAVVLRNLRGGGFQGALWPVNRRHDSVAGGPAWRDVQSLPAAPELAVICTPAEGVPALVAELGRKGTRAAIVLSSGLQQPVAAGGPSLEQAMLEAARPFLLRILGPNCIGALVPGAGLNASFAPGQATAGTLAFVTQSGALATAMLDWANERGIGFSHFVSLGNSADVDFGDMLDYLGSDPGTRAILLYVESIRAARKFMSAARAAARNKPVILVKAGRTAAAAQAASTHTGALAGSDTVFDAAVHRSGMLRVDTLEALFDAAQTLAWPHPWRGERLALLTNGGGAGVLAADALACGGGRLAVLSDATREKLDAVLPPSWSHANPVDIGGDAPVARYTQALEVLMAAAEVDGVLFMHAPTAIVPAADIAAAVLPLMRKAAKPVLSCWLGGKSVTAARSSFAYEGLPWYSTPERGAQAWLQLAAYYRNQAALQQLPGIEPEDFVPRRDEALSVLADAAAVSREWLDPAQAQAVMAAYGIPTVATAMALDADEAAALAAHIGYPVALKIVSPQVVHKSDVGGVALNLASAAEVRAAAVRMRQQVACAKPEAVVLGFAVQAMARRPHGTELIAGLATDPLFGPVVLFGQGGTGVELSRAHAVALAPLNAPLARDLIERSGLGRLLAGYRGQPGVDQRALVDTLLKLSQLACDLQQVAELDINPLLADANGVLAVDTRIRLRLRGAAVPPSIRPYPRSLEQTLTVAGAQLLLRPIRPDDAARLHAFYENSSPEDMRLRFFMARREVPHSELARYSQIDYDREMTFIALPAAGTGPQPMVAEVRAVCDPDNLRAEFAIQVGAAWQGKGLGRALLKRMVAYLREHGTAEVVGQCLPENAAMAALARQAGFEVRPAPLQGTVDMRLALR